MTHREYEEYPDDPIDETDDEYPAEFDELFFDDDDEPTEGIGETLPKNKLERDQPPTQAREAGLTGGAIPADQTTQDDLSPETLISEDGSRSPREPDGEDSAADQRLAEASADEIGAGSGLDEAELARARPLDGQPWDGDNAEPLAPEPTVNK
ncbi:hypothetical protein [Marinimicrobium sp. ABcell2]|uniref:hypothetical protein n=1 Tax=Marinimicrobium sp. ABcell2 TaxID=3069751 RepID=UPI0027B3651E|nr:hypothetical protein [Marinimicrobium sp. ABcell2]MDQ2075111.1 hypothetical protein [Marinimicrobium sp. ABcell2]